MSLSSKLDEAADFIHSKADRAPQIGVVLGSGWGHLAEHFVGRDAIPYEKIPHFPKPTVTGHKGELSFGTCKGYEIVCLRGRAHCYEGHSASEATLPVRVLCRLGISALVITCAAGGLNPKFRVGDLMVFTDHINLTGRNPLVGPNEEHLGPRFPDMSQVYDGRLRRIFKAEAATRRIRLREGVYVGVLGPSYETPAEVRMLRALGGDAVGMSAVLEAIVGRHQGVSVCGICCITNAAAAEGSSPLRHEDVLHAMYRTSKRASRLLINAIEAIGHDLFRGESTPPKRRKTAAARGSAKDESAPK